MLENEVHSGHKIKEFRKKHKVTQIKLAELSKLNNTLISSVENGWEPFLPHHWKMLIKGYAQLGVVTTKEEILGVQE